MNTYEDAVAEIARSDYGYNHSMDDGDKAYHNGAIGQIAIANAIKDLADEYERRTNLMEGFYSVAVKIADSLDGIGGMLWWFTNQTHCFFLIFEKHRDLV